MCRSLLPWSFSILAWTWLAANRYAVAQTEAPTVGGKTSTHDSGAPAPAASRYREWQHSGECWLLTTKEGADLPADAVVIDFPVLVRLRRADLDFGQAQPHGEDLRFADTDDEPLAFQIEEWDAAAGIASVWVRVPRIAGAARQRLRLFWGNPGARSESDGGKVFGARNGFISVLHMDEPRRDAVGTLRPEDQGTHAVRGMVGTARHLDGHSGVFCGDQITAFPQGAGDSSTEAWFRAEVPNTTVLAWGKEQRPGKVMMNLRSPPHMAIQCYFADVEGTRPVPMGHWVHVVHTYRRGDSRLYVDGVLDAAAPPILDIPRPVRFDIGGWHGHGFVGDIDEVRISTVARSPAWIRLQYENQKPLQTLVGPIVRAGAEFSVSVPALTVAEGQTATVSALAGGAQKVYWLLRRDGVASVVAVDQYDFTFVAGRTAGDRELTLLWRAVWPTQTREIAIPVTVHEDVPEPEFSLTAPAQWDGRETLTLAPRITNLPVLRAKAADVLTYAWRTDGMAVVQRQVAGRLLLERAMNSGTLAITLTLDNGGPKTTQTVTLQVQEPTHDAFVAQPVANHERPQDNQFFARDDQGMGSLVCRGALDAAADMVYVRVHVDGEPYAERTAPVAADGNYVLTVRLKPGLVRYRCEFGSKTGDRATILYTADNLVCGDAYLIDGQSNAEATDVGKDDPPFQSDWIRTFGCMSSDASAARTRVWGNAVCRSRDAGRLQVGYWALELARRLVESQQIPICILNGAVGGSRIDQHQRNEADPEDVDTIYGRLLWRARQARLTHGVRAVLWHQGENDQGADGPTGRFGWETYRDYFVAMAAGWQRDYPNLQHRYVFQIWPKACAMGIDGSDDMLREVQRTLSRSFSRSSTMSTLGIQPGGGCHFPLAGWAEFARLICPLIERDIYGVVPSGSITPPDLRRAVYANAEGDALVLEFDQPVVWDAALASQFYLDGEAGHVVAGAASESMLTLRLAPASTAHTVTYLDSRHWSEKNLLRGRNGIAALTFCRVPIEPAAPR